jgi:enoyl-CoA hydratase
VDRRDLLLGAAPALGLSTLVSAASEQSSLPDLSGEQNVENQRVASASAMVDIPKSPDTKLTVERRGQIVLIGINRPQMFNRIDPDTFYGLAKAYYDFDNDSTLRAAVLFGHGDNFSRGNDVEAFSALAKSGQSFKLGEGQIDPLGRAQRLSKPLVVVVHGDTWNMGHELHLAADIRVANADVRYGQNENARGRVPGNGAGPLCQGGRLG